jgi:hypothetical protein
MPLDSNKVQAALHQRKVAFPTRAESLLRTAVRKTRGIELVEYEHEISDPHLERHEWVDVYVRLLPPLDGFLSIDTESNKSSRGQSIHTMRAINTKKGMLGANYYLFIKGDGSVAGYQMAILKHLAILKEKAQKGRLV